MSSKMTSKHALIRLLTQEEGGRFSDPLPNYHVQVEVGNIFTSCVVHPVPNIDIIARGQNIEVMLAFTFYEHVKDVLDQMVDFEMYEGSKKIGNGKFIE